MKKYFFILAAAALGFASCSNDETIESAALSESNEISFRPLMDGVTRTFSEVTTSTMQTNGFYAIAYNHSNNSVYFGPELFTNSDGSYRSSKTHYWPATGNLDFIGYWPNQDTQFASGSSWNTFTLSPADDVSTHNDYVVAATLDQSKPSTSTGVPMHFKHLGSQIILKVYNSKGNTNGNMKATVQGWKIGYVSKSGTYTFATSTATATAITAPTIVNGSQKDENVPNSYSQTVSDMNITGDDHDAVDEAVQVGNPIVIVPQDATTFTSSNTYATGGYLPGAFIAVKLLIQDGSDHTLANATADGVWAAWPITNNWVAGNKYTYTINLSQGGYKEKDTEGQTVKPWLAGAEIFFSSVDVTGWVETAGTATDVNP